MSNIGYVRTSQADQNLETQIAALERVGENQGNIFIDQGMRGRVWGCGGPGYR